MMESTSKYFDVFLHEDIDDFDDKTLAAAERSVWTASKVARTMEKWWERRRRREKTSKRDRFRITPRGPIFGRSRELRDGFRNTRGFYERNVQTHSGNFI